MLPNLVTTVSQLRRRFTQTLAVGGVVSGLVLSSQVSAQEDNSEECPNLAVYYPVVYFANNPLSAQTPSDAGARERAQWAQLAATLADIQASCLRSSEYYALLGAAQLNSAQLQPASESLERALLLDPNNGAAQIDFASALFASGQLFPALQLNDGLLARTDLPEKLRETLVSRDKE